MQTINSSNPLKKLYYTQEGIECSKQFWTDTEIEELREGMIISAINDLRDGRKSKRMHKEAEKWLTDDDYVHPFSFTNCCISLGLNDEYLRQLLSPLIKGGL